MDYWDRNEIKIITTLFISIPKVFENQHNNVDA